MRLLQGALAIFSQADVEISAFCVRGVLSAKVPNSSFGEAHSLLLSEPTHMEEEERDQENEKEDGRDCEECKVESRREVRHTGA